MKRTPRELKQIARGILPGKYGTFIGAYLISMLITIVLSTITTLAFTRNTITTIIIRQVTLFIVSIITSIFTAGLLKQSLNASRQQPYGVDNLFYGFSHHPDRIIACQAILLLISELCNLPATIYTFSHPTYSYSVSAVFQSLFISYGLLLLGSIVTTILLLPFSLCIFLLVDDPELKAFDALRISMRMMKGNKWRFFYLDLTFLGLTLLGVLSCGVGLLWVEPYMFVTRAQFYRELIGELDSPIVAPPEPEPYIPDYNNTL